MSLSPNGILALSGRNDGTARLWNTDSGDSIQCFESKLGNGYTSDLVAVACVGFVVNGQFRHTVFTGNGDGSITLSSMEDMGKLFRTVWPHGIPRPLKYVTVAMVSHAGGYIHDALTGATYVCLVDISMDTSMFIAMHIASVLSMNILMALSFSLLSLFLFVFFFVFFFLSLSLSLFLFFSFFVCIYISICLQLS